jgi:hypothetical protein
MAALAVTTSSTIAQRQLDSVENRLSDLIGAPDPPQFSDNSDLKISGKSHII